MPCVENSWSYCSGVSSAAIGTRKLQPHDQRFKSPECQEHKGGDDVAHPDLLVIDATQEPLYSSGTLPQSEQSRFMRDAVRPDSGTAEVRRPQRSVSR